MNTNLAKAKYVCTYEFKKRILNMFNSADERMLLSLAVKAVQQKVVEQVRIDSTMAKVHNHGLWQEEQLQQTQEVHPLLSLLCYAQFRH